MVRTEIVYEEPDCPGLLQVAGRAPFWPELRRSLTPTCSSLTAPSRSRTFYRRALHDDDRLLPRRPSRGGGLGVQPADRTGPPHRLHRRRTAGVLDAAGGWRWNPGNSMFALAAEHEHLRTGWCGTKRCVPTSPSTVPGLPLYLTRFIQDEIARQLDDRRSLGQHLAPVVRDWRRGRRNDSGDEGRSVNDASAPCGFPDRADEDADGATYVAGGQATVSHLARPWWGEWPSFATYFGAFPAVIGRHSRGCPSVRLELERDRVGGFIVRRSAADGRLRSGLNPRSLSVKGGRSG